MSAPPVRYFVKARPIQHKLWPVKAPVLTFKPKPVRDTRRVPVYLPPLGDIAYQVLNGTTWMGRR